MLSRLAVCALRHYHPLRACTQMQARHLASSITTGSKTPPPVSLLTPMLRPQKLAVLAALHPAQWRPAVPAHPLARQFWAAPATIQVASPNAPIQAKLVRCHRVMAGLPLVAKASG